MTTLATYDNAALVSEFAGGTSSDVSMMIGVGLVKDSDAVFFQYLGEEQTPSMMPSASLRLSNVKFLVLTLLKSVSSSPTKFNLFLESSRSCDATIRTTFGQQASYVRWVCITRPGHSFQLDSQGYPKMPCFVGIGLAESL